LYFSKPVNVFLEVFAVGFPDSSTVLPVASPSAYNSNFTLVSAFLKPSWLLASFQFLVTSISVNSVFINVQR